MDAIDDKVNLTANIPPESSRPIRLGDAMIADRISAVFSTATMTSFG
jgi:hypothetical protein